MSTKKAAALVAQRRPQEGNGNSTQIPDSIVQNLPPDVKAIRDFSERRHIPVSDMVEVVRTIYPKYDRFLHSRCVHGDETGVMLRPDALKTLLIHFREDGAKRSAERPRKKPNRVQCRLSDRLYTLLQRHIAQTGQTTQEYLEELIITHLTKESAHGHELRP